MVLLVNGMVLSGFVGKNGKIIFRLSSPPVTDQEILLCVTIRAVISAMACFILSNGESE